MVAEEEERNDDGERWEWRDYNQELLWMSRLWKKEGKQFFNAKK